MLYLSQILSLASLALAAPPFNLNTKRQVQSCIAQKWNLQQFETFTLPLGATASPGAPSTFDFTHISFYFGDPNFNDRALCSRSIAPGDGALDDGNFYPCAGFGMSFQYLGGSIELKRTGVDCGNVTYTALSAASLSLECYKLFGGESCEAVTQINAGGFLLQQTG